MPTRVAVAGVTSGLGHAIVSGLLDESDIQVVLLTRQTNDPSIFAHFISRGAKMHQVDYTSLAQLIYALAGVETVISTIFSRPDITPTINLIHASKTAGVRRFAPSEFAFSSRTNALLGLYEPKRRVWEELKRSGLEYTAFQNGVFMDYFAFGAPKKYEYPLKLFPFIVDIAGEEANIPGTGDESITFTRLRDIGRLVVAAVKLQSRWPEELGMESERTTYNWVVRHAEAVTGKSIRVNYTDKATISRMLEDKDDEKYFYAQALDVMAKGLGYVPAVLNDLAPDVATTSVEGFISEYWGERRPT